MCHRAAVKHYQEVLTADRYDPRYSFELIYHAVLCNMGEAALEEGSRLLIYLRGALLHEDAVSEGMYILSHVSEVGRTEKLSLFLNELGLIFYNVGDYKKAIEYYEKALKIDREIYGETHPAVATRLNNLGLAWDSLGNSKKAYDYIQRAHKIFQETYGDQQGYDEYRRKVRYRIIPFLF